MFWLSQFMVYFKNIQAITVFISTLAKSDVVRKICDAFCNKILQSIWIQTNIICLSCPKRNKDTTQKRHTLPYIYALELNFLCIWTKKTRNKKPKTRKSSRDINIFLHFNFNSIFSYSKVLYFKPFLLLRRYNTYDNKSELREK